MKIYIDVLVITHALISLIYLQCISRIVHQKIPALREAAACALGGAGSLIAMIHTNSFGGALGVTLGKLAVISAVIIAAYLPESFSAFIKRLFLYGLMEVIFGGCCFMLINLTHSRIMYMRNYVMYFDISLLDIGICSAMLYVMIVIYETVQRRKAAAHKKYRARYTLGRYEITLPAIADTGNCLSDSFTGQPVVIFRSDDMYRQYELDIPERMSFYGFHPIPYNTVGGEGLVYVTSKGEVTISCGKSMKRVLCCVGIIASGERSQCAVFNPCLLT